MGPSLTQFASTVAPFSRHVLAWPLLASALLLLLSACGGGGDDTQFFSTTTTPAPTITTTSLREGVKNQDYRDTIEMTGGDAPFTWRETTDSFDADGVGASGTPCEGLTLDLSATSRSTTISGTPIQEGICGPFTIEVQDSASPPRSDTQELSIIINDTPQGRNDSIATATPLITNGDRTITSSISPYADPVDTVNPDNDFYELTASAGNVVTLEITARRLNPPSPLDSVLEIVDSSGSRFTTCLNEGTTDGVNPGSTDPTPNDFDDVCLNDDIELGVVQDSKLEFEVPGSGTVTFFVRVLDWRGDARPDMIYELNILGAD